MIYIRVPGYEGLNIETEGTSPLLVMNETHSKENEVLSQTLETGRLVTDHIVPNPDSLEVTIHSPNVSSEPRYYKSGEKYFADLNAYRTIDVYRKLSLIRDMRLLCEVDTLYFHYKDMAIKSITLPHEAPFKGRADIVVNFVKINLMSKIDQYKESLLKDIETKNISKEKQERAKEVFDYQSPKMKVQNFAIPLEEVFLEPDGHWTDVINNFFSSLRKMFPINQYNSLLAEFKRISLAVDGVGVSLINVAGQVMRLETWFDSLSGSWKFTLGGFHIEESMIEGGRLIANEDCLRGVTLSYRSFEDEQRVIESPVRGLYVLESYPGALNSPAAFWINPETGFPSCSVFFATSDSIVDVLNSVGKKSDLFLFDFDEQDWTIV